VGVAEPRLYRFLGLLFMIYFLATLAGIAAHVGGRGWWHVPVLLSWGFATATIAAMIHWDLWDYGLPIVVPAGVSWGMEHQASYGRDYLYHLAFAVELPILAALVWGRRTCRRKGHSKGQTL